MASQLDLTLPPLAAKAPITFARHETFHPRFGWLKKGFDRASQDAGIFLAADAPVRLGVGKNMVRAIRYWCHAFGLLADDQPTDFGMQLLGPDGWDPYLEDPASLWLLHWQLLAQPCQATAWDFAFNEFQRVEFTFEELFYELCDFRDRVSARTADSSLKKDVSCLLRMYTEQPLKKKGPAEDSLDCPFTALGLLRMAGDTRHYTFRVGYKPSLPPAVVVYACLCQASRTVSGQSIPLASLLYDRGSPGRVLRLTESALCAAIEQVGRQHEPVQLSEAAGKLQLGFKAPPLELGVSILDAYYATGGSAL